MRSLLEPHEGTPYFCLVRALLTGIPTIHGKQTPGSE